MAYRYNIRNCSTQNTTFGYANSNGIVTIGRVYKDNGVCWEVLSLESANGPQSGIFLENLPNYTNCTLCIQSNNPPPPPPPPSGGANIYNLLNCSTNQFATGYKNNGTAVIGRIYRVADECWEVMSFLGVDQPTGDYISLDNSPLFNTCIDCLPAQPPGGGGSSTAYIYKVRQCGAQSSAAIIDAYRLTTDLFPGYAVNVNGICYEVQATAGYPISVPLTQVPAGTFNMSTGTAYPSCQACPTGGTGPGGGSGPGGGTGPGGFQGQQGLGQNDGLGGNTGPGGFQGTVSYTGYNCIAGNCVGTNGPSTYNTLLECQESCAPIVQQESTVAGYNCVNGNCVGTNGPATYNSLQSCQESCSPILYNCTNNGCVASSTGTGQYASLIECTSNCSNASIFECTLVNCLNPNDTIIGWKSTITSPGVVYKFTDSQQTRCYTLTNIIGTTNPTNQGGVYLEGKETYNTCEQCNPTTDIVVDPPDPPAFCDQFPDHPSCDPCYNSPCALGCPLECDKCPGDPRCVTTDPCQGVVEPNQGDLLTTWYAGPPVNMIPDVSTYSWEIDPCWQWKYCVCRSQPDPIKFPYKYEYRICLCGEPIENSPNPCPAAGTFVKYECKNTFDMHNNMTYEKWGVYTNGSCGTYEQLIDSNSAFCGAPTNPSCPQSGLLVRTYCINNDKYGEYHDGNCGKFVEKLEVNSKGCGYVDPPPPPPPPPPTIEKEPNTPARIYYPIKTEDTLRGVDITSFALWSNNTPFLLTPSTQSLEQSQSLSYILHVYDKNPNSAPTCSAELQYNIIYADYEGKGAKDLGGKDNETLSKAMYTQYAHVLLPYGQTKFNFDGTDEDYVYIVDIARKRFKQSLDPGNWEITFSSCSFSNDVDKDSILTDMYTASYQQSTLTLVDSMTNRPEIEKPVYLSSKSYDVYIGTIEDGIGTNYITSSIASASLAAPGGADYVVTSNVGSTETVIVQGSRIYYWYPDGSSHYVLRDGEVQGEVVQVTPPASLNNVNTGASISTQYSMSLSNVSSTGIGYVVTYEGSWTGSISLPAGTTLTPSILSGSCQTTFYYDSSFQILSDSSNYVRIDGQTFNRRQPAILSSQKQKLTVNSVTYDGVLKWATPGSQIQNYFTASVPYNTSYIKGNYSGSIETAFVTDEWGIQEFIEDPISPTTDFTNYRDAENGFILVPVKRNAYGQVYPSHGIIVLSGKKLDALLGLNTNRSIDKTGYNTYRLFHSMKMVIDQGLTDLSGDKLAFYARGVDIKHSSRYFITLKNSHLNYSNNPTYVTGSEGDIISEFTRENKAYFSSIGLYNDEKELLAIGKISKPIMSSLTDEMLFTVKITQ